ncbi:MAG: hypothetical protein CBB75_12350 [bacterium TMED15]|nr:MAG: hypothetical protein CBB75_12350 [bacterium TMED15]
MKEKTIENSVKVKDNSVAIVGWHDGGAGQIHSWIETGGVYSVSCFVNPKDGDLNIDPSKIDRDAKRFFYPEFNSFKGLPLISSSDWCSVIKKLNITKVIVTTDNLQEKYEQIKDAKRNDLELINVVHNSALVMDSAFLGENIIIYPNAYIGYYSELYTGVSINTGAQIDHHNVIKECSTIDPGVIFAGNVTVGAQTHVHTGTVVKNRIRIGSRSILGAGSVIIEDVPDKVTVVGVPGRIVKYH